MENSALKILLIEDSAADAELILEMLHECNERCVLNVADRLSSGLKLLDDLPFDVVLLDLGLPDSMGLDGLRKIRDAQPRMPLIVMTGFSDAEVSIQAIALGAQDFLVKGRFDCDLLYRSVRYSIERKRLETEREKLIAELQQALANVKQLSGLLPICASCKKIRDDKGYWTQVESFISDHTEIDFTHTVCPDCTKKLYPEYYESIWGKDKEKSDLE